MTEIPQSTMTFPLPNARVGERLKLVSVRGGRRMALRLAELGLTPGVEIRLLQDAGGALLLSVRDSRLAVGKDLAQMLLVLPLQEM